MTTLSSVQTFLDHIFSGRMEQALAMVADDAIFIAGRPTPNPAVPLHGTYIGKPGAAELFRRFGELLEPGEFHVDASFAEGEHAALYGRLRHRSRATGRDFASNWALIARVREGRLVMYHFYEDTAALAAAL